MEEIKRIKKIIYFGAGIHFECVAHFPYVSEFVFVDTQPRSEHDIEIFNPIFYRDTFINNLLCNGIKHMILLTDIRELDTSYSHDENKLPFLNPTLFTFVNQMTDQIIRYYISTNIQYNYILELLADIKEADGLIVSGYFPDKVLYNYWDNHKLKHFIGYSRTCYHIPMDEMKDTIYCDLYTDKYFDHYYLVDYESGAITKYSNFKDFIAKEKGIAF